MGFKKIIIIFKGKKRDLLNCWVIRLWLEHLEVLNHNIEDESSLLLFSVCSPIRASGTKRFLKSQWIFMLERNSILLDAIAGFYLVWLLDLEDRLGKCRWVHDRRISTTIRLWAWKRSWGSIGRYPFELIQLIRLIWLVIIHLALRFFQALLEWRMNIVFGRFSRSLTGSRTEIDPVELTHPFKRISSTST